MRKIKIACRTWEQVEKLCEDQSAGRNHLSLKGVQKLRRGDRLMVALRLPDELVLSVAAEVSSVRQDPVHGESVTSVYLVGLTPEVCARMRSMCIGARSGKRRTTYTKRTEPGKQESSGGLVLANLQLRKKSDEE